MSTPVDVLRSSFLFDRAVKLRALGCCASEALDSFLEYTQGKKIELYSAQEEALLELYASKHVVLNTPTGSGKSLVALGLHFLSLVEKKQSVYTCPIKALVNEKFLSLCRDFGPDQVGMMTGDASVNPSAPILCCTAEILANMCLRLGDKVPYSDIIMDEFHYYADRDRGTAWQIPLISLKKSRFLLMSATMGESREIKRELTLRTGIETATVYSNDRPVPLDYQYSELPLGEAVSRLISQNRAPIYLVSFTQRGCAEEAQNFMSVDLCTKEEKKKILEEISGFKFSSPYGNEIKKLIKHGYGIHHAGLLPKYRVLVEKLAQKGLLKLIFGTDTLGMGVNVPIRTVLFTRLCKFDGQKSGLISVRDFQQISGRAGRKGFDDLGTVVVQAPEHVIENKKLDQKAGGDAKKRRKMVSKKPPERGFVPWGKDTFDRLINGVAEPLTSRFEVTHAMILQVLGRADEDGCGQLRELIRACHESEHSKKQIRKRTFTLFRSLVERQIIQLGPLRVNVDLQQDFSLNQTLSLFLLDQVQKLDSNKDDFAVSILSFVEAILDNPELILRRQLDRVKRDKIAELKQQGMDYDQRMEELDKLEYPKPNAEQVYDAFNEFCRVHPWVGNENIRPKSIAREMVEDFYSFSEYVKEYGLERCEGLLLRYLFDVYKTLVQTVPSGTKNEEVDLVQQYLSSVLRSIDSSLMDEWLSLKNPVAVSSLPVDPLRAQGHSGDTSPDGTGEGSLPVPDPKKDERRFNIWIRNEVFRAIRLLSQKNYEGFVDSLDVDANLPQSWTAESLGQVMGEYYQDHSRIRTDTQARASKYTTVTLKGDEARVTQVLVDVDGLNDWQVDMVIDLLKSRQTGEAAIALGRIVPAGALE